MTTRSFAGHRRVPLAWLATLVIGVLVGACSSPSSLRTDETGTAAPPTAGAPPRPDVSTTSPAGELSAADLATGLDVPWGVVPLDDGSTLVGERDTGTIRRVGSAGTATLRTLADVRPGGEGGLLGLTMAPGGDRLFAYFTADRDNRIEAMSWDGTQLGPPQPVFTGIPKGSIHNGGRMAIGPDGFLYVGTGETGQRDLAQDRGSLGGKILRLTLAGRPAPGNPFDSAVWSYGHRNVQGLAFDARGRLWASEFGQNTWDELNLITPGGNYGWPAVEGTGGGETLIDPQVVWRTGDASPSGLAFWQGELWMASLRGARLWQIPIADGTAGQPVEHFTGDYGRLRSVVPTADDSALLVSTNNTDGRGRPRAGDDRILRITR